MDFHCEYKVSLNHVNFLTSTFFSLAFFFFFFLLEQPHLVKNSLLFLIEVDSSILLCEETTCHYPGVV